MMFRAAGLALVYGSLGCLLTPCSVRGDRFEGPNLNGDAYLLQSTPNGAAATANWSTRFEDYPGGVEAFEFYAGPITTTYSQVFWRALPVVQLPQDIVQRFDGKVMAVVGFEADQVRRKGSIDFDGSVLAEDTSVPITVAYNHHYGARLLGKNSRMVKMPREDVLRNLEGEKRTVHPVRGPYRTPVPVQLACFVR